MYLLKDDWAFLSRVPPFGYLRINSYLHFPAAFRSLSRPSSAPGAKAFPLCSFLLDLFTSLTSNVVAILHFFAVSSAWLKINLNCIYACSIFIFQAYRALALTATSSDVKVETANQNLLLLDVFLLFDSFLYMFSFQGAYVSYLCNRQWRLRDSNSRPPACKAGALPTELNPHGTLFVLCS